MLDAVRLEQRKSGIGGSDSPVVLGVSPFKTRNQLWREKVGLADDTPATPAMKRGEVLEPVIADLYSGMTGRRLRRSNRMLFHKDYEWLLANVDREIVSENGRGPGVLEIKSPGLSVFNRCRREGLPPYYIVQLQHYLAVTGRAWGAFAVFNAEKWEMVHFDMDRDEEMVGLIIKRDWEFWQRVVSGEEVRDEDVPFEEIARDIPKVGPSEVVTADSPQWREAVDRLRDAIALKKEAETLEDEAKEDVKAIMAGMGADVVQGAGARIYFRHNDGRETFDLKRFKADHPEMDLIAYMKKGKPYRTFSPYFLKGGAANE